jgi:aspartate racemase
LHERKRHARIFEQSPRWSQIEEFVVLPSHEDQQRIHQELLYRVKQGDVGDERVGEVEQLLGKYQVQAFIAGCTEMHLLTKRLVGRTPVGAPAYQIADPLLTIARTVRQVLDGHGKR